MCHKVRYFVYGKMLGGLNPNILKVISLCVVTPQYLLIQYPQFTAARKKLEN
jgi:hypothetical protein